MATNLKDGKTAQSSDGSHGGNRAGDRDERELEKDGTEKKSSQAAGKDPHHGKD
jgi:hypothetical protein